MDLNFLEGLLTPREERSRFYGVTVGVVTNNQDPDGLGRVKVRFPWLSGEEEAAESFWARLATPMAGKDRGLYLLPEVDDEVLVAFEHGDIRFPYVMGALWNGQDKPPEANDDGKNNKRTIKSRSGHIIRLDDTDGGEKIEIVDKTGKNSLIIEAGAGTITLKAEGDITLESTQGKVIVKGQAIEIQSTGQDVKIEASASMDVKAGAQLNLKGAMVNIN